MSNIFVQICLTNFGKLLSFARSNSVLKALVLTRHHGSTLTKFQRYLLRWERFVTICIRKTLLATAELYSHPSKALHHYASKHTGGSREHLPPPPPIVVSQNKVV